MSFLAVPCKKPGDTDLGKPIMKYIKDNYGENIAEECKQSVITLKNMRGSLGSKLQDKHPSTAEHIASYHDILMSLENRVQLSENGARVNWKWYDITGKSNMTVCTSLFERANLIFCYGAALSQIAESCNLTSDASLQQAMKSFKTAALAFDYLTDTESMKERQPLPDMTMDVLCAFSSVMTAQAQECVFLKAEKDGTKAAITAKIASQTKEYYEKCYMNCGLSSVKYVIPRDWLPVVNMKRTLYAALTEFHQAKACQDAKQYGEQIARLRVAYDLVKSIAKSLPPSRKQLQEEIKRERELADKDNDLIYHDTVPKPTSLLPVSGVDLVKKTGLSFPLATQSPSQTKDMFKSLLPMPVVAALNNAKSIRASLIGAEALRLREATATLNAVMVSLNLPTAIQTKGSNQIPDTLLSKAALIRSQGGAEQMYGKIVSLSDFSKQCQKALQNASAALDSEDKSDENMRKQFGDQWFQKPAKELTASWREEIQKLESILKLTESTDAETLKTYNKYAEELQILSQPESELVATIKNDSCASSDNPTGNESAREALAKLCSDVERIKSERADLQDQLELVELPPALTEQFLKMYQDNDHIPEQQLTLDILNDQLQGVRECVRESLEKQETLLAQLQSQAEAYFGHKPSDSNQQKPGGILTRLTAAADEFQNLSNTVKEGTVFYENTMEVCLKTQSKISDFCMAREVEKKELMADITASMTRTRLIDQPDQNSKPNPAPARPPASYNQSGDSSATAPPAAAAATAAAASAPLPPATTTSAPMIQMPQLPYNPYMYGHPGAGWNNPSRNPTFPTAGPQPMPVPYYGYPYMQPYMFMGQPNATPYPGPQPGPNYQPGQPRPT